MKEKKGKTKEERKEKKPISRRKTLLMGIVLLIIALSAVGVRLALPGTGNGETGFSMEQAGRPGETAVTASGVTSLELVNDTFPVENLDTPLLIEEVYLSAGAEIKKGAPALKLSEDAVAAAREELETAWKEAQLKYRTGAIEYEQDKITAKYDYEKALLEGGQAEEVYQEKLRRLSEKVETARAALDEADAQIEMYEQALENDTYAETYPYAALKALYDENLKLLEDKMKEWGVGWSQVTKGGGGEYEKVLAGLYAVLEKNLTEYEQAKESYDNAVADAELGLQKLKLNLSGLKAALTEAKQEQAAEGANARLARETALAKAERAETDYETALKKAQSAYEELKEAEKEARANLELFEESVGDGYYYASSGGSVLMSNCRAGGYLQSGVLVAAYGSRENVTVTVSVDQSDIASLNVGDGASVAVAGYGAFRGTVTAVYPVSSSSGKRSVAYDVTVTLEGDVSGLCANLSATVVFGMGGATDETVE